MSVEAIFCRRRKVHKLLSGEAASHRWGLQTQEPRLLAETLIAISSLPLAPHLVLVPELLQITPEHELDKPGG